MARIPADVWRFCMEQIKLYPLRYGHYEEEKARIEKSLLRAVSSFDVEPSSGLPVEEHIEDSSAQWLEGNIMKMNDVIRGLEEEEKAVLESIWEFGWRDNQLLSEKLGFSVRTVANYKHTLVKRVAVRWGML